MNPPETWTSETALAIFELMQRLHREHRLTSILATHNTVLAGRADRVLQLEHGLLLPVAA